jgi:hypothetical protein
MRNATATSATWVGMTLFVVLRTLFVYLVYATVVGALLIRLVTVDGAAPAVVDTLPSHQVDITLSVIDGSPEQVVVCTTAAERVASDAIAVHRQADLDTLLHDLGCG